MNKPIYVIGHKNPDTDSIVSAIAYANYLNQTGTKAIACRCGSVSSQSEYILDRFHFEFPTKLYSAKSLLKDIELDKPLLVKEDTTIKEALDKVKKSKNKVLIVVDKDKKLEGLVSLGDLNSLWMMDEEALSKLLKTISIDDVVKTFKGQLIIKGDNNLSGKIHMFPSLKSNVDEGSIVLLRNEPDKLQYCLDLGAKLLIITTSSPIPTNIIDMAKYGNASIVTTTLTPLDVARYIFMVPRVSRVMVKKDKIIYFKEDEAVSDVSLAIASSRKRAYPVINSDNKVVASLSRFHLFNYEKKKFILVDHNEYKQMVDDIDQGEILEIIDHHRFGGIETDTPISITTKVVGATCSIIANKYFDNKVKMSKDLAGLLLSGIIADTINFKSPTTTDFDIDVAKKLVSKSGLNIDDLAKDVINAQESISDKRMVQIVYDDFKEYNIASKKIGLAQNICKSKEEYLKLKGDLKAYLEDACKQGSYDLLAIMLTNPNGSGSYLIGVGDKKEYIDKLFIKQRKEEFIEGLVSRKKQLIPELTKEFNNQ